MISKCGIKDAVWQTFLQRVSIACYADLSIRYDYEFMIPYDRLTV